MVESKANWQRKEAKLLRLTIQNSIFDFLFVFSNLVDKTRWFELRKGLSLKPAHSIKPDNYSNYS